MVTTDELEKRVKEAEARYSAIAHFGIKVASELGERTRLDVFGYHTHATHILTDFFGFEIITDTGQTSMGGNDLIVKYSGKEVLKLHWQAYHPTEIDEVRTYVPGEWEAKLSDMVQNPGRYMGEFSAEKAKEEAARREEEKKTMDENTRERKLAEKAEKLKIL